MKRILVIDDDPVIRQVIGAGLEEEGYQVFELESGLGAVDTIIDHEIDLIILDIFMDRKEGMETLMEIRKSFTKKPVIAISSSVEFLDITKSMGANRTLHKPIDLKILVSAIQQLLH